MSYSLVRMKILDYNQWRLVFDRFTDLRTAQGCTDQHVYLSPDNPNEVIVLLQWGDADQGRAYFSLPELREGMKEAGVQGPPIIEHVNDVT